MTRLPAALLFIVAVPSIVAAQHPPKNTSGPVRSQQVNQAYGKLPLRFEANAGQTDARVKFLARGRGYTLFLTSSEAVLALQKTAGPDRRDRQATVGMRIVNASPDVRVEGAEPHAISVNYFVGDSSRWRRNVPSYSRVFYRGVYPGIDVVFYGNQGQLEYDFIVSPHADPEAIRLAVEGTAFAADAAGDLIGAVDGGSIRMRKPVIYQEVDGVRVPIPGAWRVGAAGQIGFHVAAYDRTKPLVIDPVLSYFTYLGGSMDDVGAGITVDAAGNSYVTGSTTSIDFPSGGAVQPSHAGSDDVFVTKLDPTGTAAVYSTYLGGSGSDAGWDIAVDAEGNAHVTGATLSPDFPTAGALQAFGGETDVFVAKLGPTGSTLVYSTFLGGSDVDSSLGIAVDSTGSAYVVGSTLSPNFPTTAGAYQTTPASGLPAPPIFAPYRYDAFVTKLTPTGAFAYSTYLGGGANAEVGTDIAVDGAGNAYVTGTTRSVDYPTTPGAFQTVDDTAMSEAAYVTKLNPTGSSLVYSTYLSGSLHEFGSGIAVDAEGHAYVAGGTQSADFPVTANAAQPIFAGVSDAFIVKFNPTGTAITYSTYLGGTGQEWADDIAIDSRGNAYLTGTAQAADFPTTAGVFQPAFGGGPYDSFVAKIDSVGGGTVYSSYLGGSDAEFTLGIAVDSAGSAYVTGATESTDLPTTGGSFQPTYGGSRDAFVAKIDDPLPAVSVGRVIGAGAVGEPRSLGVFALAVQRKAADAPIVGSLHYVKRGSLVRAVTFTTLSIADGTATIEGTCTINRSPCTFIATATEGGDGEGDEFVISISGAAAEGGVLRLGRVRIRP